MIEKHLPHTSYIVINLVDKTFIQLLTQCEVVAQMPNPKSCVRGNVQSNNNCTSSHLFTLDYADDFCNFAVIIIA